jgi:hypothetical protein
MANRGFCSVTQIADRTIFDRLDWYGRPEVYEQAKQRFSVLMKWLLDHNMLNDDGKAITESGIQDDYVLYDGILTAEGTTFLTKQYEGWGFAEGTSNPITTRRLDAAIKGQR